MEPMINLKDLLKHEIVDLRSAEEQIIEALPAMIEKANNTTLKESLQRHLQITEGQLERLNEIEGLLGGEEESEEENEKRKGFFSSLFGGNGKHKCKGMEGLITEGEKIMGEEMSPEVLDAAIIAAAQKIEHYEISGYGTARAYARELNLGEVAELLEQTLDEEYEADDRLTDLAVGRLNEKAQHANGSGRSKSKSNGQSRSNGSASNKRAASQTRSSSRSTAKSSGSASKRTRSARAGKKSTASSKRGGAAGARSKAAGKTTTKKSASKSKNKSR